MLKSVEKERIQTKAKSQDPRVFWNLVSEMRNGKQVTPEIAIDREGFLITDGVELANAFGEFFINKVEKLPRKIPTNQCFQKTLSR